MSTPSPELQARIAQLRIKAKEGTLTLEEMKEAIQFLRQERMSMPPPTAKTKKAVVDADSLLGELGI